MIDLFKAVWCYLFHNDYHSDSDRIKPGTDEVEEGIYCEKCKEYRF